MYVRYGKRGFVNAEVKKKNTESIKATETKNTKTVKKQEKTKEVNGNGGKTEGTDSI